MSTNLFNYFAGANDARKHAGIDFNLKNEWLSNHVHGYTLSRIPQSATKIVNELIRTQGSGDYGLISTGLLGIVESGQTEKSVPYWRNCATLYQLLTISIEFVENEKMRDKNTVHQASWMPLFVAYCNGASFEDLAQNFSIPEDKIRRKAVEDNWLSHRTALPLVTNPGMTAETALAKVESGLTPSVAAKFKVIEENREKNLKAFEELRDHAVAQVKAFKDGSARVERAWNNKGSVVTHEAAPGPGDWVNLATYLRTIAEGTYAALGDRASGAKNDGSSAPAAANLASGPAITIILPAAVAQPREARTPLDTDSQVIDLTDVKLTNPDKP